MTTDPAQPLRDLEPRHEFFIGIDSDGCAFDTMEVKHKECFAPNTIKHWRLQAVSKYAREAAEFVNLYSKWRGINRWPALVMVFDLLREREEVLAREVYIPEANSLRAFIRQERYPHSDAGLKQYMQENPGNPELENGLRWTEAVNAAVADMVVGVPPFPYVRRSLQAMAARADMIVVSATPNSALEQEWNEHNLAQYVRVIAGQDMGKKSANLKVATSGRYAPERILMIGDAPGDMQAAKANGALFFPINPGDEEHSWKRFYEEGMERFFAGTFAGAYEQALIAEFDRYLPEVPPWQRAQQPTTAP